MFDNVIVKVLKKKKNRFISLIFNESNILRVLSNKSHNNRLMFYISVNPRLKLNYYQKQLYKERQTNVIINLLMEKIFGTIYLALKI